MGLTAKELASVVEEIAPALADGWVQKVFQPTPRTITLEIRAPGRTLMLLCSADPETARIHLLGRKPANPASPPPFCQFLRAHIHGAHIDGLEQVPGDRIVRLRLTSREGPCSLLALLTGRNADLLLLDAEDKILTTLEEGQKKAGQPYRTPTRNPQARDTVTAEGLPPDQNQPFPWSHALEQRYQAKEEELTLTSLRQRRGAELRKSLKKTARRIEALRADLEKAERYREYARYGELLKANLGLIQKGQEQAVVIDYFDPAMPELTLPLDPSKGPQANMDDYFKKHRKYLAADREIKPRLAAAEKDLQGLQLERKALELGTWQPTPNSERRQPGPQPSAVSRSPEKPSGPFRRFTSTDGLSIYVGRNARENDELTFKFAHSDDLWLHAHGTPGSHVVVRLEKGADPPQETIRDAATLALLYSDLKKSGKGEVIYTRRKWVRKAKGQPPGTVTVTQEKALFVQLDKARLDRMKERSGKPL
ncbi:MAG: fibronectin-binding domain-containing protein [Nitrospira sp.]|nr:fibronectin-binding domain-containing protein [Nitrospira sp.]